jgi:hypothetical protein
MGKSPAKATKSNEKAPAKRDIGTTVAEGAQPYLDRAIKVLEKFNLAPKLDTGHEMIRLLDEVKHVNEAKALAIGNTVKYMSSFNQLVRDNVENINIGSRYLDITQAFDSVREDSKKLIAQLDDGRIDWREKVQNLWMKLNRGTPSARFEKISDTYKSVAADTKDQLDREDAIMDAYVDFRFALKESEIAARELFEEFIPQYEKAKDDLAAAQKRIDDDKGSDPAAKSRLELNRDEARQAFEEADRSYQLLKDIAENLAIGYDVGETLITKLKQTHDVKDRVYRRSVTFFTTNEHVFTVLGTVYTSQHGLHEATKSHEAMKEGINKGIEDVAELGRELERAAVRAGYGSTINPASVEKLVRAISDYQIESIKLIAELREESEENAAEIRRVVEEGKKHYQETLGRYILASRPAPTTKSLEAPKKR